MFFFLAFPYVVDRCRSFQRATAPISQSAPQPPMRSGPPPLVSQFRWAGAAWALPCQAFAARKQDPGPPSSRQPIVVIAGPESGSQSIVIACCNQVTIAMEPPADAGLIAQRV